VIDIKQKRADYLRSLENSLVNVTHRLRSMPEVIRVILFGSYADGRRDLFTDLDILVIMDTEKSYLQRTADLYQALQVDVDMDLFVYTPLEIKQMRDRSFIRQALKNGKVLYEKKPSG